MNRKGEAIFQDYIDKYMEQNGTEIVKRGLDVIIRERSNEGGPTLEEKLKNRVLVPKDGAPSKGEDSAPITLVEFSDFQSPYSRTVVPKIEMLMAEYKGKIQWVFRNNPMPYNSRARATAIAARAAFLQNKFWEFHTLAFANQLQLTDANYLAWAKEIGLNLEKFKKDLGNPDVVFAVDRDRKLALEKNAAGVPSFFINGVFIVGDVPYGEFKEVVDALLHELENKTKK